MKKEDSLGRLFKLNAIENQIDNIIMDNKIKIEINALSIKSESSPELEN